MKKLVSLALAIVSLTVLGACSSNGSESAATSETTAAPKEELTVTYVTSPLNVPSIVEKNQHIFGDNLKDHYAKINYAEITSGADQTQALASGDVQLLYAVGGSSVIQATANGQDIKVLDMYSRSPKSFAIFSKDSAITSPEQLKGKKVGGPVGTNLHELLSAYLDKDGLSLDDVEFMNMTIPDAMTAVDSGDIDIALLAGPAAYKAEKSGLHKVTDGTDLIAASILVATSKEFYEENPEVIKEIRNSETEIRDFMKNDQAEAITMTAKELDLEESAVKDMYKLYDFSTKVSDQDMEGLQKTADFMLKTNMIEKEVDVKTLFE